MHPDLGVFKQTTQRGAMRRVFFIALSVRWTCALALFSTMGASGLMGADSHGYLNMTQDYLARMGLGGISGWGWLGPDPALMPLPSWLWILTALLFDGYPVLSAVICQGVVDSFTCILIFKLAREFDWRWAWPAGLFAALNPTQVVMACLYYPDTVFLFFVALSLYLSVWFLSEPRLSSALLLGVSLAGALLSRVLIAPWVIFLIPYLAAVLIVQRRIMVKHFGQLIAAALIALMSVTPIIQRNYAESGRLVLTNQTGAHYAFWVVPLVMQVKDGTSWEQGVELMRLRLAATFGTESSNRGENAYRLEYVAKEVLLELGTTAIAKAWFYGASVNLGAPVATIFPPLAQLPRTGFYSTPGATMTEKILNFLLKSDGRIYAWMVSIGIAGLAVIRLIQLFGLAVLLRMPRQRPATLLILGWATYVLLVNGPIASPKYRLPIEPTLLVSMAAGYCLIRRSSRLSLLASPKTSV